MSDLRGLLDSDEEFYLRLIQDAISRKVTCYLEEKGSTYTSGADFKLALAISELGVSPEAQNFLKTTTVGRRCEEVWNHWGVFKHGTRAAEITVLVEAWKDGGKKLLLEYTPLRDAVTQSRKRSVEASQGDVVTEQEDVATVAYAEFEIKIFSRLDKTKDVKLKAYANAASEEIRKLRGTVAATERELRRLRAEVEQLTKDLKGARIGWTKQAKKARTGTAEEEGAVGSNDAVYVAVGLQVLALMRLLTTVASKLGPSGVKKRGGEDSMLSTEWLRKLGNFLLFITVPKQTGHGRPGTALGSLADTLDVARRNVRLKEAVARKTEFEELTSALDSSDETQTDWDSTLPFLKPSDRKTRSDAMSAEDIGMIRDAWDRHTEVSPNSGDVCRRYFHGRATAGSPARFEVHQKHYSYVTVALIQQRLEEENGRKFSSTSVHAHQPFYVRPGVINTCVCEKCENVKEYMKACHHNAGVLDRPYRRYVAWSTLLRFFRACRPVLSRSISDSLNEHCRATARGLRPARVVRTLYVVSKWAWERKLLISEVCAGGLKSQMVRRLTCHEALPDGRGKRGKPTCYSDRERQCKCCLDVGDRRALRRVMLDPGGGAEARFPQLRRLVVGDVRQEQNDRLRGLPASEEERSAVYEKYSTSRDEDRWTDNDRIKHALWRLGDLFQTRTHPYEFTSNLKSVTLPEYVHHYAMKEGLRYIAVEYERNIVPSTLWLNIDFSENFTYNHSQTQTQSAHWKTYQSTLFVCLIQYLDNDIWTDSSSPLQRGDKVSFEVATETGGTALHYGEVLHQDEHNVYVERPVEYRKKNDLGLPAPTDTYCTQRDKVHKRVMRMIPLMTFSNDKEHDTYFVQKFFYDDGNGVFSKWLSETSERIRSTWRHLLVNSDGAGSHFKQKYTLQYFCTLILHMVQFKRFTWHFGCPGHGKGTWDGLGGVVKTLLKNLIIRDGKVFHSDQQEKLYEWAKVILEESRPGHVYKKIEKWFIRWQDISALRPGKKEVVSGTGKKTNQRERDRVSDIKAFKEINKNGLGTHDIFEYEVSAKDTVLLRRTGCACPEYCMQVSLDECKKCMVDGVRAEGKLKSTARRVAAPEPAAATIPVPVPDMGPEQPAPTPPSEQATISDEVDDIPEPESDDDSDSEEPIPEEELSTYGQTWGIVMGKRRGVSAVKVGFCCCNKCHGTDSPREIADEASRKKLGQCNHIHVTCWGNTQAVQCRFCSSE